jgi:2-succinyl-5-enolpyruvyl-6-hydroxy-3-cyclohexene-1-carboxylate synthase
VALVATSGSAIANWAPAVAEADMARLPLILLSADRPPELQDCGANQTMDQIGLFGRHVRAFHALPPPEEETGWLASFAARVVAASLSPLPGPVHVNVPLREPLSSACATPATVEAPVRLSGQRALVPNALAGIAPLLKGRGVIICGPEDLGAEFRREVRALAQRLQAPVFADLLCGLRAGDENIVLAHPDQVARAAPGFDWALRFGPAPVCRATNDWLAKSRALQIVVSAHVRFADPARNARFWIEADPAQFCRALAGEAAPPDWAESLLARDAMASRAAEMACTGDRPFEGAILRGLLPILPGGVPLFLANSLTLRAAEWFAGKAPGAQNLFGNRGLSGIDGNLSTACGLAAARGRCVAVLGDLAFLHDLNALSLTRAHPLTILLLDNGGGGIFDHLPQKDLPEFEQGWLTPPDFAPEFFARAFGLDFHRAETVSAALAATQASFGAEISSLIHIPIDRRFSRERIRAFHAAKQEF